MVTKTAKRISIFAFLSMVCTLVGFVVGFYFVQSRGALLISRAQTVADHMVRQQTYGKLEELIARSVDERTKLKTYFLTEAAAVDFLATIEDMEHVYGIAVTTDTLKVEPGKDFDTLTVHYTIKGEASRVYTMIQFLETLPYMSYISRLDITKGTTEETATEVTSTVDLVVSLMKV